MNQTTTRTARRQPTVTHGKARLTHADGYTLDECLDAGAGILTLMPDNGRWADYLVRSDRDAKGKVVGYRLEQIVSSVEDKSPVYDLDSSFGGIEDFTCCDCPDAIWNHRNSSFAVPCKHVRGLRAALKNPNETVSF